MNPTPERKAKILQNAIESFQQDLNFHLSQIRESSAIFDSEEEYLNRCRSLIYAKALKMIAEHTELFNQ